eukprot:CAMPEP_0182434076 /NCGR_PEP_ID=MMETSP1167-20130531/67418_1 /TAXON_ID=2988 /ORGANISM="Mallomonas Sp, Strain CCMP3275" /LENGTH=174 /DNA_ID=CAMNT_0024623517 /DNA_START=236 /DNA_END=760 /DNA_ORIENTATION=+
MSYVSLRLKNVLNRNITSDLRALEILHKCYSWIPGPDQIRPDSLTIEKKMQSMERINNEWASVDSYILHTIFEKPLFLRSDGLKDVSMQDRDVFDMIVFRPNDFPYDVGRDGNHFVLWFGVKQRTHSDLEIDSELRTYLDSLIGSNRYLYGWYENPNMTVPEYYHVQVFWYQIA